MDQVAPVAVQPAFRLHEVEEQHAGERGERQGVPVGPTAGRGQAVRQPLQRGTERPKEPRGDPFARERFADPQAERQRRFPHEGAEPLERVERAARRSLEGNRREADRRAPPFPPLACGRAPARADEAPRARAERTREAPLCARGQALGRCADRPLGVAGLDREHAERLMTRHQRRSDDARRFCLGRTEPGSGWHGLPRRVKPERPKKVAKIVDLLGAGEKVSQHHGTPGSETTKVGRDGGGLGTAMLRGGANYCGSREPGAGSRQSYGSRLPAPVLYVLFLSLIEPFTVSSANRRPPLPIVPCRRRGPRRPVTMSGKSVTMSPLTVLARTSVDRVAGRSSVMAPFTVRKSSASVHVARPIDATMEPFTVCASAYPDVEIRMLPFTVFACTSLARLAASTSPFTVVPTNRTSAGTRTVKSTVTSLSCTFMWPPSPASQVFSRRPSLGYTAQIVTPSSCCTTSIFTSLGSLLRACFTAVTSTSPEPATARTSPFTPLISIALPEATLPFQWNSSWAAAARGTSVRAATAGSSASIVMRIVSSPRGPRPCPCPCPCPCVYPCPWTTAPGGKS